MDDKGDDVEMPEPQKIGGRGADGRPLPERRVRLALALFFASSLGYAFVAGFVLAGGRLGPHGFLAPECEQLGIPAAPPPAEPLVPQPPEEIAWDPAAFDAAALFGGAASVPEFVDPELMLRVDAVRAGYYGEMGIPHTSRRRLADAMPQENGAVAFLVGGLLEKREGTSTEVLFRQESNFLYLSGFDHEDALLVVGLRSQTKMALGPGEGWLFIAPGDPVWGGGWQESLADCATAYDVEACFWVEDLEETMASLAPTSVYTLPTPEELPAGAIPPGATRITTGLSAGLSTARVVKTEEELEVMRVGSAISVQEHEAIMMHVRCGNYESEAESLFRYVAHNYGARHQAYLPIVGSGEASALLHVSAADCFTSSSQSKKTAAVHSTTITTP